jgi:hypothetical protein
MGRQNVPHIRYFRVPFLESHPLIVGHDSVVYFDPFGYVFCGAVKPVPDNLQQH